MEIEDTPVSQLMTTGIETTTPETPVRAAAEKIVDASIGSLVVVDGTDELEGVLTSSDLVEIISESDVDDGVTVRKYMSDHVVTVGPENSIREAAVKMMTNDIQHLPVYDDDSVVGMLSTADLASYLSFREARSVPDE